MSRSKGSGEVVRIKGKRVATPEYRAWQRMKNQCLNAKAVDYPRYGGVGVKITPAWEGSYETFLADMGRRPSNLHVLDREDRSKGFNKDNCRWVTRASKYARRPQTPTKALANELGVKISTAQHYLWRVRCLRKGVSPKGSPLSPRLAMQVDNFMKGLGV